MSDQTNQPAGGPKTFLGKVIKFAGKAIDFDQKWKISNILTGWIRSRRRKKLDSAIQKMSSDRLAICKNCPMAKHSNLIEIINGNAEMVYTQICDGCKCPLLQKSLVKSEQCPLNKWPILN